MRSLLLLLLLPMLRDSKHHNSCDSEQVFIIISIFVQTLLPRAHAQGVKQSVCMSVVVGMKIASSGDLGICTCCNNDESVDIGEKLVPARLKLLKITY